MSGYFLTQRNLVGVIEKIKPRTLEFTINGPKGLIFTYKNGQSRKIESISNPGLIGGILILIYALQSKSTTAGALGIILIFVSYLIGVGISILKPALLNDSETTIIELLANQLTQETEKQGQSLQTVLDSHELVQPTQTALFEPESQNQVVFEQSDQPIQNQEDLSP